MDWLDDALTVDPGFDTGWAYWIGLPTPVTGFFSAPKVSDTAVKIGALADNFRKILAAKNPRRVFIEDQWFSEFSLNSMTSVKSGAFKKLTWVVGGYIVVCSEFNIVPELIAPIRWKGNMNDAAVRARVKLITGDEFSNSHICDAVGIGLYIVDKFIKVQPYITNCQKSVED